MSPGTRNEVNVITKSTYQYRSPMNAAVYVGLQGTGVGFLVASIQTAFDKHSRGAMGVLTRSGGTIAFFAAMGATFAFADAAIANARQKNDPWNGAAAGCAIGLLAGARGKSIPAAAGACAAFATIIGSFDATGGRLRGIYSDETAEQKEERRRASFKGHPPTDPLAT